MYMYMYISEKVCFEGLDYTVDFECLNKVIKGNTSTLAYSKLWSICQKLFNMKFTA